MDLTSSGTPTRPEIHWSLAAVRPGPLASRIATAALAVGIVGGMISAYLAVLFAAATATPVARVLALGLPLVLVAMIGWRLAAVTDDGAPRSGKVLVWTAYAAVGLIAVAQAWAEIDGFHLDGVFRGTLGASLYGILFGLMPAAVAAIVLIPTALALHAARSRISLRAAQVGLTVVAMLVTGAFDLWATADMHSGNVTGMAAALAGTGVALTGRWCLVGTRPCTA
ncbi:hypothetical protein ACFFQW_09960 [Umezawaea endophytica]|uniref:Uncharacterized protein n=1 Tax=Umezawaea endophytica TaxID=1654476 RepID=A0A9X3A0C1_9PSEU|nr:hypothetical protein [Umezawaea endophytica]MCS7478394.1 hypothetical protein [Umezawaea endophytica]